MKEILFNLALIHLNQFCKANKISTCGTYCVKNGRGFAFSLVSNTGAAPLVSVQFRKSGVPTFRIH